MTKTTVVVARPAEPTEALLRSMAMRFDHSFGLMSEQDQHTLMSRMSQVHEEVMGTGFYKAAPSPEPDSGELARLEREIATRAARWTVASHIQDWDEGWLDIGHGGLPHVIQAAKFLEAISDPRFERHPTDPNLVRVKQEKGDE